jgi:hypothetical protein
MLCSKVADCTASDRIFQRQSKSRGSLQHRKKALWPRAGQSLGKLDSSSTWPQGTHDGCSEKHDEFFQLFLVYPGEQPKYLANSQVGPIRGRPLTYTMLLPHLRSLLPSRYNLNLKSVAWVRERTIPTEWLPFVSEVRTKFADRGCHVVNATDPYGRILWFLDRSRYFSIKLLLNCTHEADWTPVQTHYFSDNLVAQGIEPRPLDL